MQTPDVTAGKATLAELGALFPQPKSVTIAGREVEILPSSIRQGTAVLHKAVAFWNLRASPEDDELVTADENPEAAVDLLHTATGLDREWLATLPAVDKVELAMAWMEVNGAFFVLRPMLARAKLGASMAAMFGVGPMRSTNSTSTATPIPEGSLRKPQAQPSKPSPEPVAASASTV